VDGATEPRLLTPADIRALLDAHGLAPRRTAGQNFVVDPNTVRKVVRDAGVGPDDVVLEVGPGLGSLTLALAAVARHVVAVEIDEGLVAALRDILAGLDNVTVVRADAVRADLDALVDGPARMVSNLPYSVATPVVMRVLAGTAVSDVFVMVQREVGERWAARPGDEQYGAVSVKLRLAATPDVVAAVPRTVFYPVPRVDSVTVRIVRRPDALPPEDRAAVGRVVNAAFAQRRKTLRNALQAVAERPEVERALGDAGLDPAARAETVDPEGFVRLARALHVLHEVA
jgi:16S rRNA (adenine1518-N6/adenine1519-N6)-dimethyltransferase